jgi:gamma-glutamyltranspeptidase / glutathione hydrolase
MQTGSDAVYSVRRAVAGNSCMVSTGHHLATLAGVEMLQQGGNAVDAAVAAGAVASVVLPHACGLGGDAFAIGFNAKRNSVWVLNASGRSPQLVSLGDFPQGIPPEEVASTTVPGIVHGWSLLLKKYGTRSMKRILSAAIRHAEKGFVINEVLGKLIHENTTKLNKHPHTAKLLFPDGRGLTSGQVLRQGDLASTLKKISAHGPKEFYAGSIAKEICNYVQSADGFLRPADMRKHKSKWENAPIRIAYRGCEVLVPPPNSLAILLLAQLKLATEFDLESSPHNSAEYIDRLVRAKRIAFKGVLPLLADLDHMEIEPSELLSPASINRLKQGQSPPRVTKMRETSDTTCIVTVDREGNCVSLIQSLFFHFGCGAVAGRSGVFLNNRMTGFSLKPDESNVLQGGKRPAHTLSPALVLRNGKPYLVIATPGAFAQTQTLCQVLNNILLCNMEVQESLEVPRWFDDLDEVLLCEDRIAPETIQSLSNRGYKVRVGAPWEAKTGSVQCIMLDSIGKERTLYGAADPRRHGCALGW